ncbi:MAG: helicase HerA-like domain-containing protein, partial [Ilumatobacteraceae bacterium]
MADFLLGGRIDTATRERTGDTTTIRSSDLTTHGVIVGMTGSGKTGLGVVLVEEALRAGVPALLIDPKGDLTNLCLTFPALAPTDFEPWVNEGDARNAGQTVPEFAAAQATAWRDGLAGWQLGPPDIAALRQHVELTVYTPGSTGGVGLDVVGSLRAPADMSDAETVGDEIEGFVSGLLSLVGIEADPLSSREHILLSNLIMNEWSNGRSLDLRSLVGMALTPPIRTLGVFELDAFFPPADRQAFAMRLNGLLASPSFAAWMNGTPLDIDTMLRSPDGSPRCAIVTTAHLSDEERQFVTTLVLSKLVTWMRRQSGTTDLRALLYMDEVAGYLPPTAMPPTKKPIMTLMKQARAFGVGVVLSTQNPVDIDYKAISNAGTWMIGRLQTDRDKQRLLDGMTAAAGGIDIAAVSDTIGGLGKRQFVLRRAASDTPDVFTTRWAMSYLRGPLTREQITVLMADQRATPASAPAPATAPRSGAWAPPV